MDIADIEARILLDIKIKDGIVYTTVNTNLKDPNMESVAVLMVMGIRTVIKRGIGRQPTEDEVEALLKRCRLVTETETSTIEA